MGLITSAQCYMDQQGYNGRLFQTGELETTHE